MNKWILTGIACATALGCSAIMSNGIETGLRGIDTGHSDAGRWVVVQTFPDGWQIMDTVDGQMCTISRTGAFTNTCHSKPPTI